MTFIITTVLPLLKQYWKYIAMALAVVIVYFYIWNSGVQHGKAVCEQKFKLYEQKRDEKLNEKIDKLASASTELANQAKVSSGKSRAAIEKIVANALNNPKEPLIIYKDGNCTPSKKYSDTYNAIVEQANNEK